MYTPKAFEEPRPGVLAAFMREHNFATLVTSRDGLCASHIPFLFDPASGPLGTLTGHLARANPQCADLQSPSEAMVVFQGPHAYISPSWYKTQLSVPTWNYTAVHAYGHTKTMDDPTALRKLLQDLVERHETGRPNPWNINSLPNDFTDKLQQQIVGFTFQITRLEGKFKLNQNRTPADQQGVIQGLLSTASPMDAQVAGLMSKNQAR